LGIGGIRKLLAELFFGILAEVKNYWRMQNS